MDKGEGREEGEEGKQQNSRSGGTKEPNITFSSKATLVNITMSIFGIVVYGGMPIIAGIKLLPILDGIPILIPILGLLFTLLSLPLISRKPCFVPVAKYMLANIVFNTAAYVVFFSVVVKNRETEKLQVFFLPIPIISLLLTLLLVLLNRYCSLSLPNCCSNFFNLPKVEHGALVPSDPLSHYILDADGKPELVPEIAEVELKEIRSKEPVGMTNKSYNEEPDRRSL